tara:strand:- start:9 stop:731 length:723 start_codon:yes stop_codon:yes gene_type:complete
VERFVDLNMCRYLSLLLLIGSASGENKLDLLIFKSGLKYYGEFLKVEKDLIHFKPKDSKSYQSVLSYRVDRVELTNGEVLNFKNVKKPKETVIREKVIKEPDLVLKKGQKVLRFSSGQKLLINQDINGTFESITKDYLNIGTGSSQKAVPISSIITISVPDTVSKTNSFGGGALIGAGVCIIPIAILSIGNPEAHYGVVFAGIAAPIMAVLGGATSVIASKITQNKVYTISDNSWEIVQE